MASFPGMRTWLAGNQNTTLNDTVIAADGTYLPDTLNITVHKAEGLYRPTVAAMIKFNPYVACYLTPNKLSKQATQPRTFSGANPAYEQELSFKYKGEPLLVLQAWDADMIRNEFIGESPVDLMSVINCRTRKWTGPVTIWGKKGTVVRGKIWVTLQFTGGTPFDGALPAVHKSDTVFFSEKLSKTAQLTQQLDQLTKQATWCC